ncbi:histidinol-phosphate aminotransferase [Pelagibacteraceae bacterium GOM-A3]|nr:histidinol-phosphate aminotransferase [Pelagibacteraceae bacterium GOM-A3]
MNTPLFRKLNLEAYKPGRSFLSKKKNIIKLSANESALGMSKNANKAIIKSKNNLSKYPDGKFKELRSTISKKYNCKQNQIICGSGSDEIIQMLCQLFLNKGDEVVVPEYSFLMYRIYAKIVGAKVIFSKEKNFKVSNDEIIKKITKRTKIVFIANPNNPTGTYISKNQLLDLRKRLNKKILLVVDDAYFEYMLNKDYRSGLELFKNQNNVFILRTFSKIYGLASLRVGWGYGNKKIVDALYKIKPPFNVNKIAQKCAIESLKDKSFIKKSVKHNLDWAKKIKKIMNSYSIQTNEIGPNFFLLDFKRCKLNASFVERNLEKSGIILREMNSYGIKNCLRLTIGNVKENILLIKHIKKIFKNV